MNISARAILTCIWGALIIAALAGPLLLSCSFPTAAFFTYLPFSFFCHQIPERSFTLLQYPLAVCHRCSGIYLGLFLGTLLSSFFSLLTTRARRACIISSAAVLILDALIPFTGLWNGFRLFRFLTGLFFGVTAAPFAVMGLEEILTSLYKNKMSHTIKEMLINFLCGKIIKKINDAQVLPAGRHAHETQEPRHI